MSQSHELTKGNINMSVRIRSKTLLITWPHCDLTNEDILHRILEVKKLADNGIKYVIVSREFHQDGEEHHHAVIMLESAIHLKRTDMNILDLLIDNRGTFDLENPQYYHPNIQSVKSPKESIRYVKKDGQYITYGICPFKECLSTKEKNELFLSKNIKELVENGEISIFKLPQLEKAKLLYKNELLQPTFEKKEVYWYYGETGSGKTKEAWNKARELCGIGEEINRIDNEIWISNGDGKWFDGYQGQRCVIIDDLRANTWEFSWLLRITDNYPTRVPIKGGFVRWVPKYIFITAPDEPRTIYSNHQTNEPFDGIEQLERRISEIKFFDK